MHDVKCFSVRKPFCDLLRVKRRWKWSSKRALCRVALRLAISRSHIGVP